MGFELFPRNITISAWFIYYLLANLKWCVLVFTRISLVTCVPARARAIACITWRRLDTARLLKIYQFSNSFLNEQKVLSMFI